MLNLFQHLITTLLYKMLSDPETIPDQVRDRMTAVILPTAHCCNWLKLLLGCGHELAGKDEFVQFLIV